MYTLSLSQAAAGDGMISGAANLGQLSENMAALSAESGPLPGAAKHTARHSAADCQHTAVHAAVYLTHAPASMAAYLRRVRPTPRCQRAFNIAITARLTDRRLGCVGREALSVESAERVAHVQGAVYSIEVLFSVRCVCSGGGGGVCEWREGLGICPRSRAECARAAAASVLAAFEHAWNKVVAGPPGVPQQHFFPVASL